MNKNIFILLEKRAEILALNKVYFSECKIAKTVSKTMTYKAVSNFSILGMYFDLKKRAKKIMIIIMIFMIMCSKGE